MFSFMMDHQKVKEYGDFDKLRNGLKEHLEALVWYWRHLWLSTAEAKFHAVGCHLVENLEQWRSLGVNLLKLIMLQAIERNPDMILCITFKKEDNQYLYMSQLRVMRRCKRY